MRRWIALSAKLYPRRWRERYGVEFDALMEDVEPDWRELANVLGGALKMQMKSETAYWKLAAVMAAIGAVMALGVSLRVPERYESSAVVQVTVPAANQWTADDVEMYKQEILSRNSLAELIQRSSLDLYKSERKTMPISDVVERMRRDIQISRSGDKMTIAFTYPDREKAQDIVRELVTKFTETNIVVQRNRQYIYQKAWQEDAPPGAQMSVLAPASYGRNAGGANRSLWAAAGILLGALLAVVWRWPRIGLQLGAFAAGGCILAAAASSLIPDRYISTAVMRITPPIAPKRWAAVHPSEAFEDHAHRIAAEIFSDASLEELMQRPSLNLYKEERSRKPIAEVARHMREHDVRIELLPPTLFQISFTHGDPLIAQAVVREFVTKTVRGHWTQERNRGMAAGGELQYMIDHKIGENVEVLDPASLPALPVWPNRLVIAAIGLGAGLLLGLATLALRRPRDPSAPAAVLVPATEPRP
jgi:capsular polysaccharide biosynthesis protein